MVGAFGGAFAGAATVSIVINAVDNFSKVMDKATSKLGTFGKISGTAIKASTTALTAFAAVGATVGASALKTAASLESERVGFVTLLGSVEKADAALAMIKKDAAKTPFELPGLIQANKLLTSVTEDAGRSERMLLNVGKALASMGKGQGELDRIIINLQQIGAVGKASMLDIKQFAFAGIPIFKMLKESLGVTGEELDNMISSGQVSFEMLEGIFQRFGEGSGKFANAFIDQAGTMNQVVSNLKDNFTILGSEIINQTGLFDLAKNQLSKLNDFITNNQDKIIAAFNKAGEVITALGAKGKAAFQTIMQFLKPLINTVSNVGIKAFEGMKSMFNKFANVIMQNKDSIISMFTNLREAGINSAQTFGIIFDIFKKIVNLLIETGALETIIKWWKVLAVAVNLVAKGIRFVWELVSKVIDAFKNSAFGKFFINQQQKSNKKLATAFDGMSEAFGATEESTVELTTAQVDYFSNFESWLDSIKDGTTAQTALNTVEKQNMSIGEEKMFFDQKYGQQLLQCSDAAAAATNSVDSFSTAIYTAAQTAQEAAAALLSKKKLEGNALLAGMSITGTAFGGGPTRNTAFDNKLGSGNMTNVNDFILTKSGQLIKTNPGDTLFGSKGGMGGGTTINVTGNNIYGTDPRDIAEAIQRQLSNMVNLP